MENAKNGGFEWRPEPFRHGGANDSTGSKGRDNSCVVRSGCNIAAITRTARRARSSKGKHEGAAVCACLAALSALVGLSILSRRSQMAKGLSEFLCEAGYPS